MGEFSQLQVWRDRALARSLAWYREVAENRMPAKFRIGASIPVVLSLDDAPEEALWRELETESGACERCASPITPTIWRGRLSMVMVRPTGSCPGQ